MTRRDRARSAKGAPVASRAAAPALPATTTYLMLAAIVAVAAALRLVLPGQSPPGLNQDEAVNAWNAWCLLHTGRDMVGAPWPVFYAHAIGDNRTTLFFYALLPFQALGGLSVWTTRLPSIVAGIGAVLLVFQVGTRLAGRLAGLLAATFMALEPWPLFMSRWGIEGGLCPLLAIAPLSLLLAAGAPLGDAPTRPPRPLLAALAGLCAGIACYGYWPMRLYIPAFLLLAAVLSWPAALEWMRVPRGRAALLAFAAAFALTFGPLAWKHLVDPEIARRAAMTRLWDATTPLPEVLRRVAGRYLAHFGPDFLFVRGDRFEIVSPIGQGEFHWTLLPLLLCGALAAILRFRASRTARLLVALLLAYPAGDVLSRYLGVHALRSAPGIPALVLFAAWGGASAWGWLAPRRRPLARIAAGVFLVAMAALDARYLVRYFGEYNRRPEIYHGYQTDLLAAAGWLRPRLAACDEVYVTTNGMNEPFAVTLVGLGYDARRWFREPRLPGRAGEWDVYLAYGKMHFLYGQYWRAHIEAEQADRRPERVLFVLRPGELGLGNPVHVIRRPDGTEALWICEETL
jgi:4-amino-4-deoxy-L-arabinose transferase-like glycosyltransferase